MAILFIRKFTSFLFFLIVINSYSQTRDTTFVLKDSLSGIRKEIHTIESGTGGGNSGAGPSEIKISLTKFDRHDKVIYQSNTTKTFEGCFRGTEKFDITIFDNTGSYKKAYLKRKKIILELFDKDKKLLSKKKITYDKFPFADWVDPDGW
jgi:hypothetical protein